MTTRTGAGARHTVHRKRRCTPGPTWRTARCRRRAAARRKLRASTGLRLARSGNWRLPTARTAGGHTRPDSEGNIAVLLRRIRPPLVLQRLERVDQPRPGFARLDHVVDVAARGGNIRVREVLAVLALQLCA